MKTLLLLLAGLAFSLTFQVQAQTVSGFPKGEKSTADNHVGDVWLSELAAADSVFQYGVAMATFAKGARLDWHKHPGGQILLFTEGVGYYQERGKPRRTVHRGDVIKCSPDVEHWHGATPTSSMTYIATTPTQRGKTIWLKRLTEAEYLGSN
jgi:quercetin dioxygenase-like cupin family protein